MSYGIMTLMKGHDAIHSGKSDIVKMHVTCVTSHQVQLSWPEDENWQSVVDWAETQGEI